MKITSARDETPDTDRNTVAGHSAAEVLPAVPGAPDETCAGASVTYLSQDHLTSTQRPPQPRRPLTPEQLELFRAVVEDRFLVPFLEKRAHSQVAWGTDVPKRLSLDPIHRQSLDDYRLVCSGATTWTKLAAKRDVSVSTLTRRKGEAIDWLATARFILFRNPRRWNLSDLLRSHGEESVKAQLEAEADVQCDVFDQTQPSPFAPHFPVRMRADDNHRLSDHHKDLLGWAARSLLGKRQVHLSAQSAIGKASTIDLTPHLDFQPEDAMHGTLEEELEQLHQAIRLYEVLAQERLNQFRRGGSRP